MKRYIIIVSFLIAWTTSLFAVNITQEQADAIVQDYVQSEAIQFGTLYANINEPNEEGITITTSGGETFKAKYACWTYCLDESNPIQRRYLFVKEEGGSLLEVIVNNDTDELNASWAAMGTTDLVVNEENSIKLFYPNPVGDILTIPCPGANTRIEIYDLKGSRLFSGLLPETCQLNVSFLNAGIYIVNISGETYKIIKN